MLGYYAFAWLRLDTASAAIPWLALGAIAAVNVGLFLAVAGAARLHAGRARVASLDEMLLLGILMGGTGFVVFVANLAGQWVPRSVPAGATVAALVLAAWARATWRRLGELDDERGQEEQGERVLVVGAGEAGTQLVSSMLRDPQRTYRPVGLLDDDPQKRHLRIRRVPVVGTTFELGQKATELGVGTVILALPSGTSELINRLRLAASEADVQVKVLPSTAQLLDEQVGIRALRDIDLSDVLGRRQLDTDVEAIAGYLRGRKVLVTGAGGSIGAELCRQIHRFGPAELMMLDRDESALHALQLSIRGRAQLDSKEVILCDIRDLATLNAIFTRRRPEVVFHAAALKHLTMLEQYPGEAVKTNVVGTRNVLDAADLARVDRFVNVSTDKAANPRSVLGCSKRIAERLTAHRAATAAGTYLSVRFGNVLGSRGSVLTTFAEQIAAGGPVTVTHPEVTRYFMTIEEACQLVIQAATIGAPGEVLVLDMGAPVRILDMARQLIEQSGTTVRIEITGLRAGEKLHEDLYGCREAELRRIHPLVSHVPVPPLPESALDVLRSLRHPVELRSTLAEVSSQAGDYDSVPAT